MVDAPHDPETERLHEAFETHCRPMYEEARAQERTLAKNETVAEDAPWWVAIARPNQEMTAAGNLQRLGFETWFPVRVVEVKMSRPSSRAAGFGQVRPKVMREFPAMPGYVFVRHANPRAWPGMIGADGVALVLCIDYVAATVSADEIERQKARLAPLAFPVVDDALRVGDSVIITEGPFLSMEAVVSDLRAKGAVEVEVSLFGTRVPMQIEREKVERSV